MPTLIYRRRFSILMLQQKGGYSAMMKGISYLSRTRGIPAFTILGVIGNTEELCNTVILMMKKESM